MRALVFIFALVLAGCGTSSAQCTQQLDALVKSYNDSARELPRSCTVDADCVLVLPSLPCAQMCSVAVNASAADAYRQKRAEYGAQCPSCTGTYACAAAAPEVARCHGGFCRGELADGG